MIWKRDGIVVSDRARYAFIASVVHGFATFKRFLALALAGIPKPSGRDRV